MFYLIFRLPSLYGRRYIYIYSCDIYIYKHLVTKVTHVDNMAKKKYAVCIHARFFFFRRIFKVVQERERTRGSMFSYIRPKNKGKIKKMQNAKKRKIYNVHTMGRGGCNYYTCVTIFYFWLIQIRRKKRSKKFSISAVYCLKTQLCILLSVL